ncbi:MAG: DegT/DnrJ/EryC1/StrS family aminotransferase, partial [Anaerolineales bacterium]
LKDWATGHNVQLPVVPPHCDQAYHMFYMLLPTLDLRQGLIDHLKQRGIQSVFHYLPLHLSDMGRQFGGEPGDCPVTECISDRLVRLPFNNALSQADQQCVIDAILEFDFE